MSRFIIVINQSFHLYLLWSFTFGCPSLTSSSRAPTISVLTICFIMLATMASWSCSLLTWDRLLSKPSMLPSSRLYNRLFLPLMPSFLPSPNFILLFAKKAGSFSDIPSLFFSLGNALFLLLRRRPISSWFMSSNLESIWSLFWALP